MKILWRWCRIAVAVSGSPSGCCVWRKQDRRWSWKRCSQFYCELCSANVMSKAAQRDSSQEHTANAVVGKFCGTATLRRKEELDGVRLTDETPCIVHRSLAPPGHVVARLPSDNCALSHRRLLPDPALELPHTMPSTSAMRPGSGSTVTTICRVMQGRDCRWEWDRRRGWVGRVNVPSIACAVFTLYNAATTPSPQQPSNFT